MKIPEEQKREIIDGMLEMLNPDAMEEIEEVKEIDGRNLIYKGVTKDKKGRQIRPGIKYLYSVTETRPVNHAQKMGQIIADAANQEEMRTRLAEYLVKYAKDAEAIRRSIPAHVLAAAIKKSDN